MGGRRFVYQMEESAITTVLAKLLEQQAKSTELLAKLLEQQAENAQRQEAMQSEFLDTIRKEKLTKIASKMSETDLMHLSVTEISLSPLYWSEIERHKLPEDVYNRVAGSVDTFTNSALNKLHLGLTAENVHVKPLALEMIGDLVTIVNEKWSLGFKTITEGPFETSIVMNNNTYSVTGKFDAVIIDSTRLHVVPWEFKNLKDDLENKYIGQLVATMKHGIDLSRMNDKFQKCVVGFLTSGRQWVMVTAIFSGGVYTWQSTPTISTLQPVGEKWAVDTEKCAQVVKLLCFALSNAKELHEETLAAAMRDLAFTRGGRDDDQPSSRHDDDDNDGNDGSGGSPNGHTTGHATGQANGESGTLGDASALQRRALAYIDANRTAPLTVTNLQKYSAMTYPRPPINRFLSLPAQHF